MKERMCVASTRTMDMAQLWQDFQLWPWCLPACRIPRIILVNKAIYTHLAITAAMTTVKITERCTVRAILECRANQNEQVVKYASPYSMGLHTDYWENGLFTAAATESAAWRMVPPRVPPVSRRCRWYLEVHCMPRDVICYGITIPQRFGHFRGPHGFWPLLKIARFKVQNSLLKAIHLYIYSIVYSTVEYLAYCASGRRSCTICSHYPIWAGSWLTSRFAIQAMSEFQFGWSSMAYLTCLQFTRLDASNRLLKTRNMETRSRRL